MATDLNKVQIIGRLGQDPETNQTTGGKTVVNCSFATNYTYKDKDGNKVEQTDWHRVVFYSGLADVVSKYMAKGSRAYVEGRLKHGKFTDKDGIDRYTTEIVASELQMLDSKAA